ncbi:hypothetical protein [Gordonia phthalatica]|nr:hypothetical protein [Gordonia phthalatica]
MRFKLRISGKNADVAIFNDRVVWHMGRGLSASKLAAGALALTVGVSLAATGVRSGKSGSEMIPMKSITVVATKRDGMLNTIVSVTSSGGTIGLRVAHSDAEAIRQLLNRLISGS